VTLQRICRVCHLAVEDARPVCASCGPLMGRYRLEREIHDCRRWGDIVPRETRKDRRAAKASPRTTRRAGS
jgi:hypothetical protein